MIESTSLSYAVAIIIALSLIGAPFTMGDWSEEGYFSVQRIEDSEIGDETPLLQYESLSTAAQNTVSRAIESPAGYAVEYGHEDWPDEFAYTDAPSPGYGLYVVVYEGQYYRLYTSGSVSFLYPIYIVPFIALGVCFGLVTYVVRKHDRSPHIALLAALPGFGFHLIGPEFDFPLVPPMEFWGLGILATVVIVVGLIREGYRVR